MDRMNDFQGLQEFSSAGTGSNGNPAPHTDPEIEMPNPSIATPPIPEEVPAREYR